VFWNLLGARVLLGARAPAAVVAGAALGLLGVAAVLLPELQQVSSSRRLGVGVALALAGTLVASAGNLWSQRLYARGEAVVPSTAWSMLYASLAVGLYCAVTGIPFTFDASLPYVLSLLYLTVFEERPGVDARRPFHLPGAGARLSALHPRLDRMVWMIRPPPGPRERPRVRARASPRRLARRSRACKRGFAVRRQPASRG